MPRVLTTAGHILAPALAELGAMGFRVRSLRSGSYSAERLDVILMAEDVLQLLALAVLDARRGAAACHPTDAEVASLLVLEKG